MNAKGLPILRETLLSDLKQRIAEVRQGPDGLLYLLTDETAGALLKLEPVPAGNPIDTWMGVVTWPVASSRLVSVRFTVPYCETWKE